MHYTEIDSLEKACAVNGTTVAETLPYDPSKQLTGKQEWLNACSILDEIATAMKKGSEPLDYSNRNHEKWFCYFRWTESGFAFLATNYLFVNSSSSVGSRLSFPTEEMAEHFGKTCEAIFNTFLTNKQ